MDVLVIDDQPTVRLLLEEVLRGAGYSCVTSGDAEEAVRLVAEYRPRVLFLDLRLGNRSGEWVLQQVRLFDCKVEVVAISAFGDLKTLKALEPLGVFKYLEKPFSLEDAVTAAAEGLARYEKEES